MALYWVSWYQPTEDHRPIHFPPSENILGWWCTGIRSVDESSVLVALIVGDNETYIEATVKRDWPEAEEWRFFDVVKNTKLSDRFPIADWMQTRIDKFNNENL